MSAGVFWEQPNTIALWHFDGNSNDATANGHDGTDTSITYGTGSGKFGQGAIFNGSSSKITVPDSGDWILGTNNFVIAYWIKFKTVQTCEIIDQSVNDSNKWTHYYAGGNFNWLIESGGTNLATFSYTPSVGRWYFNVLTRNGNNYTFYVDGDQKGNAFTMSKSVPDLAASLLIGAGYNGTDNNNFVDGTIDEMLFISGSGWSNKQVNDYYAWAAGRRAKLL